MTLMAITKTSLIRNPIFESKKELTIDKLIYKGK
jgi:hypothetical protein